MLKEDVRQLQWCFQVIRRWLWLIVGCVLLGATGAFVVSSRMPPVYRASATLLVHVPPATSTGDLTTILASEQLALTYSEMLKEPSVLEAVIARLELEETPDALAKRVEVTPVKDTQLIRLSVEDTDPVRAALIANTIAETFIVQIKALQQAREQSKVTVTIAEAARVPENPISRRTLYTMLAALVSGMIALVVAFLLEDLDDTIKTPDDVSGRLGLSTLGAIGRLAKGEEELTVVARPLSPVAEAFHMLRANIQFSGGNKPLRILLVTSPGPQEGKSFIVANLAAAMAQAELRVVAVDADLRRPRLHQLFGLDLPTEGIGKSTSWGLTGSLLQGHPDGQLHSTQAQGLKVLPSGELPPNPIETISSQRMHKLLHDLVQQADMVLVDGPPVLPVADVAVLAPAVDGVLLVLEAGRTPREAAQHAVESLRQVGANLVGVVLNGVSTQKGSYYHYCFEYYRDGDKRRKRPS
jgi:capsular exopolysaccharide synthesis family protein